MRILDTPIAAGIPAIEPRKVAALADGLEAAFLERPGLEPALGRLRSGNALAVTSGQQPGLFTGPLYTVYKALSAAALAARLEARWQRPVVPVFWLAGDDHDYEEARRTWWIDGEGNLREACLPDRPTDAPMTPMSGLALDHRIGTLLDEFEASFPASESLGATTWWLRRHYAPGRTVGSAFGEALADLLAPFGVVCFDPTHAAAKRAMRPLLIAALEQAPALDRALSARAALLEAEGRAPGVAIDGAGSLVFLLEPDAGRDRLMLEDGGFRSRRAGKTYTLEALRDLLNADPGVASPNVLLRPVVESAILPTVAYVAGPGELAYLPLAQPLYHALEVHRQVPVPRWSGLVIEPRVERVLTRFDASLDDLLDPDEGLERRVVRSRMPRALTEAAARLETMLDAEYGTMLAEAVAIDPTLERPVAKGREAAVAGLERIVRKVERHLRRRAQTELRQIGGARASVRPAGRPQERVLTVAGLLARYGPAFLSTVRQQAESWFHAALEEASTPS